MICRRRGGISKPSADLARDFPETSIIVNHTGLPADRSGRGWRPAARPGHHCRAAERCAERSPASGFRVGPGPSQTMARSSAMRSPSSVSSAACSPAISRSTASSAISTRFFSASSMHRGDERNGSRQAIPQQCAADLPHLIGEPAVPAGVEVLFSSAARQCRPCPAPKPLQDRSWPRPSARSRQALDPGALIDVPQVVERLSRCTRPRPGRPARRLRNLGASRLIPPAILQRGRISSRSRRRSARTGRAPGSKGRSISASTATRCRARRSRRRSRCLRQTVSPPSSTRS